jgi:hypothetical protein
MINVKELSAEMLRQQATIDGLRVVRQCLYDNTPQTVEQSAVLKAINAAILKANAKVDKAHRELHAAID